MKTDLALSGPGSKDNDLDPKEYWDQVKDFDLSDAEKLELIRIMWRIMASFADQAFLNDDLALSKVGDEPSERREGITRSVISSGSKPTSISSASIARTFFKKVQGEGDE
ncbi:hypothetical protein [Roseococcus sp. YIM B11640]|uniref:hypothetical protein n=1 Tax=Roseococcus sp. YIM B11640 TaxID=3133973 RepID=UPI003C7EC623